jgi:hypothetical protein
MHRIEGFNPLPRDGQYLYAKVVGPPSAKAGVQRFLKTLEACEEHGIPKVLLDHRGRETLTEREKVQYLQTIGGIHNRHVARGGHPVRLSVLADPVNVQADAIEVPMSAYGLQFKKTACPAEAIEFLDLKAPGCTLAVYSDHIVKIVHDSHNPDRNALRFVCALQSCQREDLNKVIIDVRSPGEATGAEKHKYLDAISQLYRMHLERGGKRIEVAFVADEYQSDPDGLDHILVDEFGLDAKICWDLYDAYVYLGLCDSAEVRLRFDVRDEFVHGVVEGVSNTQHGMRAVQGVLEKCRGTGRTKVFWDMSRLRGHHFIAEVPPVIGALGDLYRDHVEQGGQPVDMAFVRPPGGLAVWHILQDGFSASGLRLWFTGSYTEAMEWLNVFDASVLPAQVRRHLARLCGRGPTALSG